MTFYLIPEKAPSDHVTEADLDNAIPLNIVSTDGMPLTDDAADNIPVPPHIWETSLTMSYVAPRQKWKQFLKALGIYRMPGDKPLMHNGKKPR